MNENLEMRLMRSAYPQINIEPLRSLPHWQGTLFLGSWMWNPYLSPVVEPKTAEEMLECLFTKLFNLKL